MFLDAVQNTAKVSMGTVSSTFCSLEVHLNTVLYRIKLMQTLKILHSTQNLEMMIYVLNTNH